MNRILRSAALSLALCLIALTGAGMAQQPAAQAEPQGPEPAAQAEPQAQTEPAEPELVTVDVEDPAPAPTAEPEDEPATVGRAVTSAVTETKDTMVGGAGQVAQQGKRVWTDTLRPMWDRFLAAAPSLVKALLVLLAFWIAAILVSAGVRKVLGLTSLDEKAARDWGLGGMMEGKEGKPRSLAGLIAGAVKALILLFGFVAFFDALDLGMVAGPLQGILDKIAEAVPSLLYAFLILAVYWIIGTLLKMAATKGLEAVGFDARAERFVKPREVKGEKVGPSSLVGRLLFYIVLLIGIPPFLDALGQQALVAPLRDMLAKVLAFLPNVAAALLLFFIGRIIATIVREVVTNFLAAAGTDELAAKVGFGSAASQTTDSATPSKEGTKSLSEIIGAIAYFFIMIPILVTAVDSLQMKAVSEPVKATLQQVLGAVPLIFLALVVVAVGYFIAKLVRSLVESFLTGIGFDELPERVGLNFLKPRPEGPSLSSIGGVVVMAIILLMIVETALATLNLGPLADLVGSLIRYLPSLFVGLVVILAALSIGTYAGKLIAAALGGTRHGALLATIGKYAIFFLGFSMGLNQLGVGEEIIRIAVSAVLGGTALALGLAFGLGGRDKAQQLIDEGGKSS